MFGANLSNSGFPGPPPVPFQGMAGGGDPGQFRDRDRDKGGIFHKTRICNEWLEGICRFGDRCKYAHGEHELKVLTQEGQEILERMERKGTGTAGERGNLHKTKLCERFMSTGSCPRGDSCNYAHGFDELRKAGGGDGPGPMRRADQSQGPANPMQAMAMQGMQPLGMGMGMPMGGPAGLMGPQAAMAARFGGPAGMMPPIMPQMIAQQQQQLQQQQRQQQGGDGAGAQQDASIPAARPSQQPQQSSQQHQQHRQSSRAGHGKGGGGAQHHQQRQQQRQHMVQQPAQQPAQQPVADSSIHEDALADASISGDPGAKGEIALVDRIRATCGILNIGNAAALNRERPAAVQAAISAVRSGQAFRANAFADSVEAYLQQPQQAGEKLGGSRPAAAAPAGQAQQGVAT